MIKSSLSGLLQTIEKAQYYMDFFDSLNIGIPADVFVKFR